METFEISKFVVDLLVVLIAGLISGIICKRSGISLLVGYLIVGALIGQGGLGFVSQQHHELEYLARAGALLLLFSVGIEFSLDQLLRMRRYFFVGGPVQMLLVAVPLTLVALGFGLTWKSAMLAGAAGALSSTILVFKALNEWGQSERPHGQRAISILLFQDVALVPLMLLLPLLTGAGGQSLPIEFGLLLVKSLVFVTAVALLYKVISRWIVPMLAGLRSLELVVLFTLAVFTSACFGSYALGLQPAIGALAAGLILGGNRLSKQIDTLVLPFRESFAAVFFVTLGTLLQPLEFFSEPLLLTGGIVGMLLLKSLAAIVALKLTGLSWKAAAGMGIGLAQLGEFSFLLIAEGSTHGLITPQNYNRMLFIALGTLICTPQLIKIGMRWTDDLTPKLEKLLATTSNDGELSRQAVVIGVGHIGSQVASQLETHGAIVCLVDFNPINLHPFAQQGFQTVAGDACNPEVLERAHAVQSGLAVVCVPNDEAAIQIVRTLRELSKTITILVRCRLLANKSLVEKAGANSVVVEEQEVLANMLQLIGTGFWPGISSASRAEQTDNQFLPLSTESADTTLPPPSPTGKKTKPTNEELPNS